MNERQRDLEAATRFAEGIWGESNVDDKTPEAIIGALLVHTTKVGFLGGLKLGREERVQRWISVKERLPEGNDERRRSEDEQCR